jgi:hypothetical protein
MPIIRIPVPLRKLVGGGEEIKSFGKTYDECLQLLCLSYPDIQEEYMMRMEKFVGLSTSL